MPPSSFYCSSAQIFLHLSRVIRYCCTQWSDTRQVEHVLFLFLSTSQLVGSYFPVQLFSRCPQIENRSHNGKKEGQHWPMSAAAFMLLSRKCSTSKMNHSL